jgi:thioredoxin 1
VFLVFADFVHRIGIVEDRIQFVIDKPALADTFQSVSLLTSTRRLKDMFKAQSGWGAIMEASFKLGSADFDGKRLRETGTLAVLFAADWCPFCRRFAPIFESALKAKKLSGLLADLTDLDNPLWETFDIQVVPTVMVFRDGEVLYRKDGVLGEGLPSDVMNEVVPLLPAFR